MGFLTVQGSPSIIFPCLFSFSHSIPTLRTKDCPTRKWLFSPLERLILFWSWKVNRLQYFYFSQPKKKNNHRRARPFLKRCFWHTGRLFLPLVKLKPDIHIVLEPYGLRVDGHSTTYYFWTLFEHGWFSVRVTFKRLFLLVLVECVRRGERVCFVWFSSGCGGLASASFAVIPEGKEEM